MTDLQKYDEESAFREVHTMIRQARSEANYQANKILINLYWAIGQYVSNKVSLGGWGKSIVSNLSEFIKSKEPGLKGFSARNIWRMKQFFEEYHQHEKLSALLAEISWTNHLHILSKTKTMDEKAFYLELGAKNYYPERDFARIIDTGTYERTILANKKLSAVLTEFPAETKDIFKDIYLFEFTGASDDHQELDLQGLLLKYLKQFLLEMGPDFSFIGEQYTVQVGDSDYKIDLLLHHRGLNCLVAVELKVTEFMPEHMGKLQFYLEALDRDVKKPHENPSIGLLICKTKNDEVVEYAMSRSVSPAVIAEYETKLIDRNILQSKLHELSLALAAPYEE